MPRRLESASLAFIGGRFGFFLSSHDRFSLK
jgi:hypothetical protein